MRAASKFEQFCLGEVVYARFFGAKTLVIKGIAETTAAFPHYLCQAGSDTYLIPMIHLSRGNLLSLVEDGNRLQLELSLPLREAWAALQLD